MGASRRDRVLGLLESVVSDVSHLDRVALVKMGPVLAQAHAELSRELRAWLRREQGSATFTGARYRNALLAVRRAMDAGADLAPHVYGALVDSSHRAGQLATSHMVRELEQLEHIFTGVSQPVALDAAAIIARGDRLLIPRFKTSARRYAGAVRDRVVNELAVSRVKGETIFELTDRLQARLPDVFAANRNAASVLARTEVMHAYNTHHVEALREAANDDPDLLARWDSTFDSRRCPICRSLDGQVRDVLAGEKFHAEWKSITKKGVKSRSLYVAHPPAHPRCRCLTTPWKAEWSADYARPHNPRMAA